MKNTYKTFLVSAILLSTMGVIYATKTSWAGDAVSKAGKVLVKAETVTTRAEARVIRAAKVNK